jgi:hypothetical protein
VAAEDSDGGHVSVRIDWGDGSVAPWSSPGASGDTFELSHTWESLGQYDIRAQAEDSRGLESPWSPSSGVTIYVDTTNWSQQAEVNTATGEVQFTGDNPHGDLGSLGGSFVTARYPEFGGYMWTLAPDGDIKYEHLDLTRFFGADSVRIEWSCRDGHGGPASFLINVNGRGTAFCANPDSFGLYAWWWRGKPHVYNWDSRSNYVQLRNLSGSSGPLLVTRMKCFFFGVWTTDARVCTPASSVASPFGLGTRLAPGLRGTD